MNIQNIIDPVPVEAIMDELTREKFFRRTNNGGNEIYILSAHDSPHVMREIGRLREISFREAGGGTGLDCDIDDFDTREENYFLQLIVWNPVDRVIVGGYRFLLCDKLPLDEHGQVDTPTSELFHYSERFGICPTPSSWAVPSCSLPTSPPRAFRRAFIRLTTFGMVWAR